MEEMRLRSIAAVLCALVMVATVNATLAAPGAPARAGFEPERAFSSGNDWEPYVVADPSSSYVYMFTTGRDSRECQQCSQPAITYRVSPDSGNSWGPVRFVCGIGCESNNIAGSWQADPVAAVSRDGTLFVVWLDDWNPGPLLSKSYDHGQTWTRPVITGKGHSGWADKPWLAVSPDGRHVHVTFNSGEPYAAASHDGGATFGSPVRLTPPLEKRYWYPEGGGVAPDGTAYFSMSVESAFGEGPVDLVVAKSTDGGATWSLNLVERSEESPRCPISPCPVDFLQAQIVMDIDSAGTIMVAYMKNTQLGEPKKSYSRTSTDGVYWSPPSLINDIADSNFPAISHGPRPGDFRVAWQDDRNGLGAWNTFYKRTTNYGMRWSSEALLSNLGSGAPYKTPAGYEFPYGDYFGIATDSSGRSYIIWGEGTGVRTGGGSWFTRGA